ncbi:HNH endonuclease [Phnomibacter ginsenosidimutans]|nr:HNH endonuclease [Phnomibacter ginsenosidimutans]
MCIFYNGCCAGNGRFCLLVWWGNFGGMTEKQRTWTREELVLAINLYAKLPFGKMHSRNADIIQLSKLIERTPSAIARKLGNFAHFDPELQKRGIKGLANVGKLDRIVWDEFYNNWDDAFIESEKLRASIASKLAVEDIVVEKEENDAIDYIGEDVQRLVSTRKNQAVFRRLILSSYNNTCCMTGIQTTALLVASHIIPWSESVTDRLKPTNGLCLNALHDKAFDKYLITVQAESLKIVVSSKLLLHKSDNEFLQQNFSALNGKEIIMPQKFFPSTDALKRHNDKFIL